MDDGQVVVDVDLGAGLLDRRGEVGRCAWPTSVVGVDVLVRRAPSGPTRENASRSLMRICMRLAPSTAKWMYCSPRSSSWPAVAALEHLAEARDLAQRLLQVVRGDVGELLELGVRALEVGGLGAQLLLRLPGRRAARAMIRRASTRRRRRGAATSRGPRGSIRRPSGARGHGAHLVGEPADRAGDQSARRRSPAGRGRRAGRRRRRRAPSDERAAASSRSLRASARRGAQVALQVGRGRCAPRRSAPCPRPPRPRRRRRHRRADPARSSGCA